MIKPKKERKRKGECRVKEVKREKKEEQRGKSLVGFFSSNF